MGEAPVREDGTVTRSAEYVGSFPVDDRCLDDQIKQLHTQLKSLKACKKRRPVSLKFSIKGVKMYDEDETTLLMAHALRRVSLSTARPTDAQFAFVSHNPGSTDTQLYCHVFKARHARAAQFLNLLLCRCFQLYYLEKHPEEAQDDSAGSAPRRNPSLLNHGFPLSVSALVSFRRAPFRGLLAGTKKHQKSSDDLLSSQDEVFPTSSPSLVRKKAMRTKVLSSGAYRSFTFTPLKQRNVQERLSQGGPSVHRALSRVKELIRKGTRQDASEEIPGTELGRNRRSSGSSGVVLGWYRNVSICESSYSLLADDVLGSYLLCPHPKKPKCGSLIIRFPSGPVTHLIENTRKGKFLLEKCKSEFSSLAELIEHYTETQSELQCPLSCARVNHCYEWEESTSIQLPVKLHKSLDKTKTKSTLRKQWV